MIGAGPAGSTAAYLLAKSGLHVLVLDKQDFPRDKLCGGLLTRKTVLLLDDLFQTSLDYLTSFQVIAHQSTRYAVNLRDWHIADLGNDGHTITDDLFVQPGGYVVVGKNADFSTNGGLDVAYEYSSVGLANGEDEIVLLSPGGEEVDRVVWGAGDLSTTAGASLERAGFDGSDLWVTASAPWARAKVESCSMARR